jgi:Na+/melibiose symporter-like transporter
MNSALTIYFGTYLWGLNSDQLAILVLDALLGASLGLFLAPLLSKKFGKRNAAFGLAVLAVLFSSTPYILRLTGLFFENGDPLLVPAIFMFSAFYNMCGFSSAALTHAMVGDVVEESQLKTGRRSEGLFYAANTFMQKSTSGLGVFVAGILVALVGLVPGTDPQSVSPDVPRNLALIFVPSILFLYIGGACFLWFYRIDRTSHDANVEALRVRDEEEAERLKAQEQNVESGPTTPA